MDKDAAAWRKQVTDEIQEQFESRLKLAKRQKQQAEEELENASERWRSERRKLNAEIDRLETALASTRESPRRRAGGTSEQKAATATAPALDPGAIAKVREEAAEKLKRVSEEWDLERGRLMSQISRLEGA